MRNFILIYDYDKCQCVFLQFAIIYTLFFSFFIILFILFTNYKVAQVKILIKCDENFSLHDSTGEYHCPKAHSLLLLLLLSLLL